MKICNHCGAVLEDYALFCNNCGMSAKEDTSLNFEETNSQSVLEENPFEAQTSQENSDTTQVDTQENLDDPQQWPHEKYAETVAPAQEYNRNNNGYQQYQNYNPQPENFATQNMGYNPQQQNYNPYTYATPQKPARMPVSARVLGIVGLVLGIGGAVDTIVLTLYSFFLIFFGGLVAITEYSSNAFTSEAYAPILLLDIIYIICLIFCAIPGIIGLALGKSAIKKGNYGKTPKIAKAMGITTIVVAAVGIVLLSMSMFFVC